MILEVRSSCPRRMAQLILAHCDAISPVELKIVFISSVSIVLSSVGVFSLVGRLRLAMIDHQHATGRY